MHNRRALTPLCGALVFKNAFFFFQSSSMLFKSEILRRFILRWYHIPVSGAMVNQVPPCFNQEELPAIDNWCTNYDNLRFIFVLIVLIFLLIMNSPGFVSVCAPGCLQGRCLYFLRFAALKIGCIPKAILLWMSAL